MIPATGTVIIARQMSRKRAIYNKKYVYFHLVIMLLVWQVQKRFCEKKYGIKEKPYRTEQKFEPPTKDTTTINTIGLISRRFPNIHS